MKLNIKPIFDKIIVKADEESNKLPNGLILPQGVKDKPKTGTVIEVGSKITEFKSGDMVMYGEYSANKFTFEGEDLLIMRESDIFAVIH